MYIFQLRALVALVVPERALESTTRHSPASEGLIRPTPPARVGGAKQPTRHQQNSPAWPSGRPQPQD